MRERDERDERDEREMGDDPDEAESFVVQADEDALRQLDAQYPVWKSTDWTPTQRTTALRGLLLLALGGGLIAGCLVVWWTASFAATLLAPIGMTLIFLGITHLNTVTWYAYRHGVTTLGERRRKVGVMVGVITLARFVDYGTLGLQLVGVSVTAVAAAIAPAGWHGFDPFGLAWLMSIPMVLGGGVTFGSWMAWTALMAWRPQRDPAAPATALAPPTRGIGRLLRWLVMGLAASGPALVLVLPGTLFIDYLALPYGSPDPLQAKQAALIGLGAALCLLLALAELTNGERAAPLTLGAP